MSLPQAFTWLEHAGAAAAAVAAAGRQTREKTKGRSDKTVLILSSMSRSLVESDFYRWAPQGRHVAGWAGGISKVVQAITTTTREPRGQYFLFFDTRSAAEACEVQLNRVYELTRAADNTVCDWNRICWSRCTCCSRSLSTCAARLRSSMVRGETMVTVFFSFLGCSDNSCGDGSKLVFERVKPRGGAKDVVEAVADSVGTIIPECRFGVWGNSENAGDFIGCGDVARRGLVFFSRVAWRRSNRDLVPPGFNTPLNMTLYRSSLISGMSTLRNPAPLVEVEGMGSEMVGTFAGVTAVSVVGSVIDLIMMGLCFGVFLLATVLLLAGVAATLDTSCVGLPSAIPIGISPEAEDCGVPALVRAMSSLDSLLSKLGFTPLDLLELGPEDVLGLAGIPDGAVLARTAMFLDGRGGRGRSSVLRRASAPSAGILWTQGRI
ncbi:hypothetical protein P885DRAFT_66158 [Corynascus similis CBS 632.67]